MSTNVTSVYLHYLVVRNSINLFAFSSVSAAVSMSSTSCVIWGRFPLLPPRLILEEVELELKPESGTGEDWYSRRKSKPPASRKGGDKDGMQCWASVTDERIHKSRFFPSFCGETWEKPAEHNSPQRMTRLKMALFLTVQNPLQNEEYQKQDSFLFHCSRTTALEKQMFHVIYIWNYAFL